MDSNSRYQLHHQPNSGLLRFRSAPTQVLANFKSNETGCNCNPWENSEPVLRFLNSDAATHDTTTSPSLREFVDNKASDNSNNNNNNNKVSNGSSISSSTTLSRMNSMQAYSTCVPPSRFSRHNSSVSSGLMVGSMGMDQPKSFDSLLLRQSSYPVGHFSNSNSFQNGYDTLKGVGNYGGVNGSDGELSLSMNRMTNQISFSSRSPSLEMSTQNRTMGGEAIETTSPDDGRHGNGNDDARYFGPGFPYASWNDTSQHSDKLIGSKRQRNSNDELPSDARNREVGDQVHTLSHHLSLPRASSDMFAMENLIQFPDSVPCKIRAKRGFATHPRSIAERIRRTRISERIRKLQELVPNMEKQTSTAEMLDLAVVYIKDLQKQFKSLSEKRAKCKCIRMQKSEADQVA
ncbi:hypothetical protein RJT34_20312 [Clitoria ternatea]|uniref:BHLH domain-containing protein n=1 Tax=Clitoria ternatea TaxID=43366 RepID=A0AAN9IT69_CLITE